MKKKLSVLVVFSSLIISQIFGDVASTRKVLEKYSKNHSLILNSYDQLAYQLENYKSSYPEWNLDRILLAIEFAAKKHEYQKRKDKAATPYIMHPIGVAKLLWEKGEIRSSNVLTAAILHDTLEDTNATAEEIKSLFGSRVLNTVQELSNDPKLSTEEKKQKQIDHAPFLSLDAQLIKLADRIYNVRDLENPPPQWSQKKIDVYRKWGAKLLLSLRGTNAALEQTLSDLTMERSEMSIEGHFKVDTLCYLWTQQGDNIEEYVRLFLDNGTSWSYPYTEYLSVFEGDAIEIVAISKEDPEYKEGKRYRIIGVNMEGQPVTISFYPYPASERENSFYSGVPI